MRLRLEKSSLVIVALTILGHLSASSSDLRLTEPVHCEDSFWPAKKRPTLAEKIDELTFKLINLPPNQQGDTLYKSPDYKLLVSLLKKKLKLDNVAFEYKIDVDRKYSKEGWGYFLILPVENKGNLLNNVAFNLDRQSKVSLISSPTIECKDHIGGQFSEANLTLMTDIRTLASPNILTTSMLHELDHYGFFLKNKRSLVRTYISAVVPPGTAYGDKFSLEEIDTHLITMLKKFSEVTSLRRDHLLTASFFDENFTTFATLDRLEMFIKDGKRSIISALEMLPTGSFQAGFNKNDQGLDIIINKSFFLTFRPGWTSLSLKKEKVDIFRYIVLREISKDSNIRESLSADKILGIQYKPTTDEMDKIKTSIASIRSRLEIILNTLKKQEIFLDDLIRAKKNGDPEVFYNSILNLNRTLNELR